jgi:hypothetical protein
MLACRIFRCYSLSSNKLPFRLLFLSQAGSLALSRVRKDGGGVEDLLITLEDVKAAIEEVRV